MEVMVIVAHPYEKSFNHALYQTVIKSLHSNQHHVFAHHLYKENFNPVLEGTELADGKTKDPLVMQHREEIKKVEGIIIIHPNWWGQPPAILKGWLDRVLRSGIAYEFDENDGGSGVPHGLLKIKPALVLNTSNTTKEREMEVFGDPLDRIWKDCVFDFCGVNPVHRKIFRTIAGSTPEQRSAWLSETKKIVNKFFPRNSPFI